MKKQFKAKIIVLLGAILVVAATGVQAQSGNWDPYVHSVTVAPAPLLPLEFNGTGVLSLKPGNNGGTPLSLGNPDGSNPNDLMTVQISLANGVPNVSNPLDPVQALDALGGPGKAYWDWTYTPATLTFRGVQNRIIPAYTAEEVTIQYKVTANTFQFASPISFNGLNVNISPPGYTNPQTTDNDKASSYTYVEAKDYGDAPSSYGEAVHTIDLTKDGSGFYNNYMYLGTSVDPEPAYQPSSNAQGDDSNQTGGLAVDDENGVTFPAAMVPGQSVTIPVVVTIKDSDQTGVTGRLSGWIDWNADGDFNDTGERIATNVTVDPATDFGAASGTVNITFTVPANATVGPTFARFRFGPSLVGTSVPLPPYKTASYGEVEDYQIQINAQPGSISGSVLADTNNDNTGDAPISGVVLTLVDGGGNPVDGDPNTGGVQPITTTTAVDGSYTFAGVPPGTYGVKETQPSGYTSVSDKDGGDLDEIRPLTVTAGAANTGNDFVEEQPGSISGSVLADTNNDNTGDAPIGGVLLTLVDASGNPVDGDPIAGGVQPITATSAGDGTYTFVGVQPGTYGVKETQPSGYISVSDKDGGDLDEIRPITVTAGAANTGNNFVEEQPGTIAGTVKIDTNNDSIGDTNSPGVTVTLYTDPNNDGDPSDGSAFGSPAVTAADGSYSFANVPPGSYVVVETDPTGHASVVDGDSTTDSPLVPADAANANTNDNRLAVNLAPGETDSGNDFVDKIICATTYTQFVLQWQSIVGLSKTNPTDNPDGDVYNNLLEYAFCMPANSGYQPKPPFCVRPRVGSGGVEAFMDRPIGLVDVNYTLLVIPDLNNAPAGWAPPSVTLTPTITNLGNGREELVWDIDSLPELANGGYAIIRVDLYSDSSKTPPALQTTFTEICGWQKTTVENHCQTYSAPFVNHEFFTGTVDSVSGNTLTLSTSANGRDLGATLSSGKSYYIEVIDGPLEGNRFDVVSGGVDTLTLATDANIYAGPAYGDLTGQGYNTLANVPDLTGNLVVLRAHKTLADVFPPASYTAGSSPQLADCVMCWNGSTFDTYWLVNDPTPYWTTTANSLLEDKNSTVIAPAHGLFVYRKTAGPVITMSGGVRENDFILPLPATQRTLVGAMYPVDQSPNGTFTRAMTTLANGFTGGGDPARVDQIQLWNGDTGAVSGFTSHWYRNTSGGKYWTSFLSTLPNMDNSLLFKGDRGAFLKIENAVPTYKIPSPVIRPTP